MNKLPNSRARATAILTAVLGGLVGLAGLEHGIFEILQGSTRPPGLLAPAIGPAYRFWEQGTEQAIMIVPNYLVSGILTVSVSLALASWATLGVRRPGGALVLTVLAVALWLVGGGFAPVFMSVFAVISASRVSKPLTAWRRLPAPLRSFLSRLWPLATAAFGVLFLFAMANGVFGYPLIAFFDATTTTAILMGIGYVVIGLMTLSLLGALSWDTLDNTGPVSRRPRSPGQEPA